MITLAPSEERETIPKEQSKSEETPLDIGGFLGDGSLTKIDFPLHHHIPPLAFAHCHYLDSIDSILKSSQLDDYAMSHCYQLKEFHGNLIKIGIEAFSHCYSLKVVDLTSVNARLDLEKRAFYWCNQLESVLFSETIYLYQIKEETFAHCCYLQEITIPKSVNKICKNAFSFCVSLKKVVFLGEFITIESGAFENCSSLDEVIENDCIIHYYEGTFPNNIQPQNGRKRSYLEESSSKDAPLPEKSKHDSQKEIDKKLAPNFLDLYDFNFEIRTLCENAEYYAQEDTAQQEPTYTNFIYGLKDYFYHDEETTLNKMGEDFLFLLEQIQKRAFPTEYFYFLPLFFLSLLMKDKHIFIQETPFSRQLFAHNLYEQFQFLSRTSEKWEHFLNNQFMLWETEESSNNYQLLELFFSSGGQQQELFSALPSNFHVALLSSFIEENRWGYDFSVNSSFLQCFLLMQAIANFLLDHPTGHLETLTLPIHLTPVTEAQKELFSMMKEVFLLYQGKPSIFTKQTLKKLVILPKREVDLLKNSCLYYPLEEEGILNIKESDLVYIITNKKEKKVHDFVYRVTAITEIVPENQESFSETSPSTSTQVAQKLSKKKQKKLEKEQMKQQTAGNKQLCIQFQRYTTINQEKSHLLFEENGEI